MLKVWRGSFWFIQNTHFYAEYSVCPCCWWTESLHSVHLLAFTLCETSIPVGFYATQTFKLTSPVSRQCPKDSWSPRSLFLLVSWIPVLCLSGMRGGRYRGMTEGWVAAIALKHPEGTWLKGKGRPEADQGGAWLTSSNTLSCAPYWEIMYCLCSDLMMVLSCPLPAPLGFPLLSCVTWP